MNIEKTNIKIIFIVLSIITITFFTGFYLNEDSAGGGQIDFVDHELGTIQLFSNNNIDIALGSVLYESSRTPLFYILNKYIPFNDDAEKLRLFWFIFSISIPLFLFKSLRIIFDKKFDKFHIFLFSAIILLSPYFRTNAFWPSSENLQIFFVILSTYFYLSLVNKNFLQRKKLYIYAILSIFFGYCAFYTDQKAFFLVVVIYFDLIRRNDLSFFLIFSFINLIFFFPSIYLYYIWGGLVPVESQFRVSKYLYGTNIFISSVGIYFLIPFLTNFKKINFYRELKGNNFDIFFVLIFIVYLIFTLPIEPITFGSGIVSKLFGVAAIKLNLNWDLIKYFYFLINLIFVCTIYLLIEKTLKNLIIFFSFIAVYNLTPITYQSYIDPIFYIIILTLINFKKNIVIFSKINAYCFLLFYTSMLIGSIVFRSYVT